MPEKKAFNRIKVALVERNKTNVWLAEQLSVSKITVSRWCTNDMQPSIEGLYLIARALNVDVRDLLVSTKD